MKKTSIYLEPEIDALLAARAAEEGVSKAEFIRKGLEALVTKPKRPKPQFGVFKGPAPADVSENLEEKYLWGAPGDT